jgi:hypothetical protein
MSCGPGLEESLEFLESLGGLTSLCSRSLGSLAPRGFEVRVEVEVEVEGWELDGGDGGLLVVGES